MCCKKHSIHTWPTVSFSFAFTLFAKPPGKCEAIFLMWSDDGHWKFPFPVDGCTVYVNQIKPGQVCPLSKTQPSQNLMQLWQQLGAGVTFHPKELLYTASGCSVHRHFLKRSPDLCSRLGLQDGLNCVPSKIHRLKLKPPTWLYLETRCLQSKVSLNEVITVGPLTW